MDKNILWITQGKPNSPPPPGFKGPKRESKKPNFIEAGEPLNTFKTGKILCQVAWKLTQKNLFNFSRGEGIKGGKNENLKKLEKKKR